MGTRRCGASCWGVAVICALLNGAAANGADRIVSFTVENDEIFNTDRYYSNGLIASVRLPRDAADNAVTNRARRLLRDRTDTPFFETFTLAHRIYTPADRDAAELLPDDHPYAGLITVDYAAARIRNGGLSQATVTLGLVGPAALGEEAQSAQHSLLGIERFQGWDNQLENEPVAALAYDRSATVWSMERDGFALDLVPSAGATAGNLRTQARAGVTARFGDAAPDAFGDPNTETGRRWGWFGHVGLEGRAIARDLVLDGNTFRDSANVDKRPFVADATAGFGLRYGHAVIDVWAVARSDQFDTQAGPHTYGGVRLAWVG